MKKLTAFSAATALMLLLAGCSYQSLARKQMQRITLDIMDVYDKETDIELARQTLPVSLKLLEGTIASDPDNPVLLTAAARSYARYTWGFIELEIEQARLDSDSGRVAAATDRAIDFYQRAIAFGCRALVHADQTFAPGVTPERGDFLSALARVNEIHAEALYWTAFARGCALRLASPRHDLLEELSTIQLMMKRVTELDSGVLSGRAHAFLGASYASLPPLWGQDILLAGEHFEIALDLTDSCYLPIRLAYALYYLRNGADADDYNRTLREIADGIPDGDPRWILDNKTASHLASIYLRQECQ